MGELSTKPDQIQYSIGFPKEPTLEIKAKFNSEVLSYPSIPSLTVCFFFLSGLEFTKKKDKGAK
jgi:hypothetical protein